MSFTNHTPNYNLPQYVGTDKPTFLGDFNNAMSTIDTALHNNEQNAGEGLSELQQAQAALSETQETLTEVQTEVANVSGIAATVNQNVQQALTAANDATTAANSATSQIQPAVTAANQASADAQAAQQVANGNVTTLNQLSERVTTLEENQITEISGEMSSDQIPPNTTDARSCSYRINAPEGFDVESFTTNTTSFTFTGSNSLTIETNLGQLANYNATGAMAGEQTLSPDSGAKYILITCNYEPQGGIAFEFSWTAKFKKASA